MDHSCYLLKKFHEMAGQEMQRNAILPLIQGLKICDFLESQIVKMMYTVVLIGRLF